MFTGTEKTNLKSDATSTEGKRVHHEKVWDSDNDGFSDDFEEEHNTILDKDNPDSGVTLKELILDD